MEIQWLPSYTSLIPRRLFYSQPEPRPLINKKSISAPEMAILPAPKGTDYIFLHVYPSLPIKTFNIHLPPLRPLYYSAAARFSIRSPQHPIYQPRIEITLLPGTQTSEECYQSMYPDLCTCIPVYTSSNSIKIRACPTRNSNRQTPRGVRIENKAF